ncbi:MAG: DnaA/Hda family protein [Rhodospirillales bacterium]
MSDPVQLTLTFEHRPALSGEDFLVAPCNREAVQWLDRWRDWPGPVLVLYGPAGCGKTHLTHVFLAQAGGRDITAEVSNGASPDDLLSGADAFVIEGADGLATSGHAETLLHVYNVARERGAKILLTALEPPSRWKVALADLRSRLNAASAVGIGAPDDALIGALLVKLFADRQLKVDEDVIPYLLARMERSFEAARRLVEAIDKAALAKRRNITTPLVRQVLEAEAP